MAVRFRWYERERNIVSITVQVPWTEADLYCIQRFAARQVQTRRKVCDYIVWVPDSQAIPTGNIIPYARKLSTSITKSRGIGAVICNNPYLHNIALTLHETQPDLQRLFQFVHTEEEALMVINQAKRDRAKRTTATFARIMA